MQESAVTSKGRTTLPKDVQAALGLNAGDRVRYFIIGDGEVRMLKVRPVAELAGLLSRPDQAVGSLDDMDAAIAAGAAAGLRRL